MRSINSTRKLPVISASLFLALGLSAQAQAQDGPPPSGAGGPVQDQSQSQAQSQPDAPQTGQSGDSNTTVTVTGRRAGNRSDRQVYDMRDDPDAQTGTAADALGKVPSVSVDNDGSVSLRGNQNVQILVDGKPSAMMQGDNRAATLQSMAGSDIESVEVISNPGAQFGSEGSGGMINIVMRRNRRLGNTGAVIANIGNDGRYNASFSGAANNGRRTLSLSVNTRHDGRDSEGESIRLRTDPLSGNVTRTEQDSTGFGLRDSTSLNGGIDFNLNDRDTLQAQMTLSTRNSDGTSSDRSRSYDESGTLISDYVRDSVTSGPRQDAAMRFHADHKGDTDGELLKFDLRLSSADDMNRRDYTTVYSVGGGGTDAANRQLRDSSSGLMGLSIDYERPVGGGQMTAGFEHLSQNDVFDNTYIDIDSTGTETLDTDLSNRFELGQQQTSAYVQFQRALSERLSLSTGLRYEYTELDIDQITTNIHRTNSYGDWHPSAHLTYTLTETAKLRLSYSHRTQRPQASDLNPFVVYRDEQNLSSGNPDLKPQETHSVELGYEANKGPLSYAVRGYYRKNYNTLTEYSYFVSPSVLLTTRRNAGEGQSGGLEFTLNGPLTTKLSLNLSGNIGYDELEQLGLTTTTTRSAVSVNGRASLDYRIDPKNRLQVTAFGRGKSLTGQGYRDPFASMNVSYRYQYSPKLAFVANLTDVFDSMKFATHTRTELVTDDSERRMSGRILYLGFSWTLGGANPNQNTQQQQQQWPGPGGGQWRGPGGGAGGPPMGGF